MPALVVVLQVGVVGSARELRPVDDAEVAHEVVGNRVVVRPTEARGLPREDVREFVRRPGRGQAVSVALLSY